MLALLQLFSTDGLLMRVWPLVLTHSVPAWFRGYVELEATASRIETFECQNVPCLLQTENCARTMISAYWPVADVDQLVSTRLERQRRVLGPTRRTVWVVVNEAVLRRPIGRSDAWREQLKHLADVAVSRRIVLQVLPFSVGVHRCTEGNMTLLASLKGTMSSTATAQAAVMLVEQPEEVENCRYRYNLVRAAALSPEASVDLITAAMEEA